MIIDKFNFEDFGEDLEDQSQEELLSISNEKLEKMIKCDVKIKETSSSAKKIKIKYIVNTTGYKTENLSLMDYTFENKGNYKILRLASTGENHIRNYYRQFIKVKSKIEEMKSEFYELMTADTKFKLAECVVTIYDYIIEDISLTYENSKALDDNEEIDWALEEFKDKLII